MSIEEKLVKDGDEYEGFKVEEVEGDLFLVFGEEQGEDIDLPKNCTVDTFKRIASAFDYGRAIGFGEGAMYERNRIKEAFATVNRLKNLPGE